MVRKDEDWELTTDMIDREATITLTGTVCWNGWYGQNSAGVGLGRAERGNVKTVIRKFSCKESGQQVKGESR